MPSRTYGLVAGVVLACSCQFSDVPLIDAPGSADGPNDSADDGPGNNVMITSGPMGNATTGPRVVFEFTVADGEPQCRFDNEPLAPCTSPVAVNLRAGIHTFHVQAQDSTGAIDTDSRLWNVECQPPPTDANSFAMYHMDEASGDTLINSTPYPASDPPRHGTLETGFPDRKPERVSPGRFGPGALRFSAISANDADIIHAGSPLVGMAAMEVGAHSWEVWANPAMTFSHDRYVLLRVGASTSGGHFNYELSLVPSGGQLRLQLTVRDSLGMHSAESQPIPLGTYHHLVFSYSPGTRPFLFVDGIKTELTQTIDGTIDQMGIGQIGPYEGLMDELHLTFHSFTEAELVDRWCPP